MIDYDNLQANESQEPDRGYRPVTGIDIVKEIGISLCLTDPGKLFALELLARYGVNHNDDILATFASWRSKLMRQELAALGVLTAGEGTAYFTVNAENPGLKFVLADGNSVSFYETATKKFMAEAEPELKTVAMRLINFAKGIASQSADLLELAAQAGALNEAGEIFFTPEFQEAYLEFALRQLASSDNSIWSKLYQGDNVANPIDFLRDNISHLVNDSINMLMQQHNITYEEAQETIALEECVTNQEVAQMRRSINIAWMDSIQPSNPGLTPEIAVRLANDIENHGILTILNSKNVQTEEFPDILSAIDAIGGPLATAPELNATDMRILDRVQKLNTHRQYLALLNELGLNIKCGNDEKDAYFAEIVNRLHEEAGVTRWNQLQENLAMASDEERDQVLNNPSSFNREELRGFAKATAIYFHGIGSVTDRSFQSQINIDTVINNIKKIADAIKSGEPITADYYYALVNSRNPLRTGGNTHIDISEIQMIHTLLKPVEIARRMGHEMRWIIVNEATEVNQVFGMTDDILEQNVAIVHSYAQTLGYGDNIQIRSMRNDIRGMFDEDEFHGLWSAARGKIIKAPGRDHRAVAFGASLDRLDMQRRGITQAELNEIHAHTVLDKQLPERLHQIGGDIAADFDAIMSLRDKAAKNARSRIKTGDLDELPPQYHDNCIHLSITRKDEPIAKRTKGVLQLWPDSINPRKTLFATHGIATIQDYFSDDGYIRYKVLGNVELWEMLMMPPDSYEAYVVNNQVVGFNYLPEAKIRGNILYQKINYLYQLVNNNEV